MVSAPWTNFVHIKQVKQWPELGHFTLLRKIGVIMRHKVIAAENVKILRAVCTKCYIFACSLHLYG